MRLEQRHQACGVIQSANQPGTITSPQFYTVHLLQHFHDRLSSASASLASPLLITFKPVTIFRILCGCSTSDSVPAKDWENCIVLTFCLGLPSIPSIRSIFGALYPRSGQGELPVPTWCWKDLRTQDTRIFSRFFLFSSLCQFRSHGSKSNKRMLLKPNVWPSGGIFAACVISRSWTKGGKEGISRKLDVVLAQLCQRRPRCRVIGGSMERSARCRILD